MLRPKTLALARCAYDLLSLAQAASGPYMLDPLFGDLQGYTAFPAAGFAIVFLAWAFFRLPDLAGIPVPIVDVLFEERIPARKIAAEAAMRAGSGPGGKTMLEAPSAHRVTVPERASDEERGR